MIYFKKDPAIRPITVPELYDALLTVWEAAVRDSHDFLSEADIRFFKTLIPDALPHLEVFGFFETGAHPDRLRGFAAIEDNRLEMLFVHPAAKGQGVGSRLMDFAIHDRNIRFVDVNEQNTQALQFYLHRGFQIIGRDAADAFGKPFPILHLTLP
ncbi:MAG: GNAT family N-acetyltransferase [Bacteroidales bacterium]|nr:GNAT family N-acetyltransferase [Bacteroidales bacterium]